MPRDILEATTTNFIPDLPLEDDGVLASTLPAVEPLPEPEAASRLKEKSPVAWERLSALVQGRSSIDLKSMAVQSREDAEQFLLAYGFHAEEELDRQELAQVKRQAIEFIQTRLLNPDEEPSLREMALSCPQVLQAEETDAARLLLLASASKSEPLQPWACAILKVMHTLVHIQHSYQWQLLPIAQEQILGRFRQVLSFDPENGDVLLRHPQYPKNTVRLHGVEIKAMKSRESLLIKLLSKKSHVAEQADDLIGLRFITESPLDALLVLDRLCQYQLILLSNANPGRARNSLVTLEALHKRWLSEGGNQNPEAAWRWLEAHWEQLSDQLPMPRRSVHNPNTSLNYRSIHITVRQMIRYTLPGAVTASRTYFPFELQLIDKENYYRSQKGEASHAAYKQRQLQRARRRVLGRLLPRHFRSEAPSHIAKPILGDYELWMREV